MRKASECRESRFNARNAGSWSNLGLESVGDSGGTRLAAIRDAGILAPDVVLNIVCGDQGFEKRVVTAERINHPSVAARYEADLELDPVVLEQLRHTHHHR